MGRNTSGVKGIKLTKGATVIGMVLADPGMSLLTVCENGYGKRTAIGVGIVEGEEVPSEDAPPPDDEAADESAASEDATDEAADEDIEAADDSAGDEATGPGKGYRRQRRGGKGLKDIKATARNGNAVKILAVSEQDDVLMVTSVGKIQRIRAGDINEIGRNTQGVRVIRLDEGDKLVSVARIPSDLCGPADAAAAETPTEPPVDPAAN
jgi:DNA gyrase subunit A